MAHAGDDGRRPGVQVPESARRRSDAANRRWLRQSDASRQVRAPASGIEAGSSVPDAAHGGGF